MARLGVLAVIVAACACGTHASCKDRRAKARAAFVALAEREQKATDQAKQDEAKIDAELDQTNKAWSQAIELTGHLVCSPISSITNDARTHQPAIVPIMGDVPKRGAAAVAAARQLQSSPFLTAEDKPELARLADELDKALPAYTAVVGTIVDGKPFPAKVVTAANAMVGPWCKMWPIATRIAESGEAAAGAAVEASTAKRKPIHARASEHAARAAAATDAANAIGETTPDGQLVIPQRFATNEPELAEVQAATTAAIDACH